MALPTRANVETLDYSGYGQPAAYLEAKSLSSGALDYSLQAQPVTGIAPSSVPGSSVVIEAATAGDTVEVVFIGRNSVVESSTALDGLSSSLAMPVALSEYLLASEGFATGTYYIEGISEAVSGLDLAAPSMLHLAATTEQVTASDTKDGTQILRSPLNETLTGADAVSSSMSLIAALSEPLSLNDTVTGGFILTEAISDAVQLADAFNLLYGPEGWFKPSAGVGTWGSQTASGGIWTVRKADPANWQ